MIPADWQCREGVAAPLRAGTSRAEAASREAPTASTSMSARSPDTPVQRPQRLRNGYGLRCTRETASETAAAATGRAADDHGTIRPLQHVAAVRRRDHDPTESAGRQRGGVHLAAVWRPRVSLHPTVTSNGSETPQKRLKFCSTSSSSPPPSSFALWTTPSVSPLASPSPCKCGVYQQAGFFEHRDKRRGFRTTRRLQQLRQAVSG